MRIFSALRNTVWVVALCLQAQQTAPPAKEASKEAPGSEIKGLPPRAAPTDYQAHAQLGLITLAADFAEHSVPTPDSVFSTEDYVAVEAAFFGPPGSHVKISIDDFTLRINGKKTALDSKLFGVVLSSLKDPSWEPPTPPSSKSKGGLSTGDNADAGSPPPVVHMPMPLQHAMEVKVQKAAIPEGERPVPVAGLLFFSYHGQTKSIRSVELTYSGPAGQATLDLQP